jgi:G3E family GTPase
MDRWPPQDTEAPDEHDHAHHHADINRHDRGIRAFAVILDGPVDWPALAAWLDSLTSLRGRDVLRVKGIVAAADRRGPVVVHAVQHVVHPPRELPDWPDADRRSRIVFIVRDIAKEAVERSLATVGLRVVPPDVPADARQPR